MVPTQSIPSYAYAYDALENFKIGVIRAAALQALNLKSRTDPLRKLRRKFYTPESAWKPDWKTVDQKVFNFCDEFKTEFLLKLQQIKIRDSKSRFPRKSNLDAGDRWAIEWLHGSPQLLDCPTDKGLGTAVLPRSKYNQLVQVQLDSAFTLVSRGKSKTASTKLFVILKPTLILPKN